jgi:hypothetical protein
MNQLVDLESQIKEGKVQSLALDKNKVVLAGSIVTLEIKGKQQEAELNELTNIKSALDGRITGIAICVCIYKYICIYIYIYEYMYIYIYIYMYIYIHLF